MPYSVNKYTDERVIRMIQSGKIDFFEIIVERYEKKMLRYGRKFLANYNDIEDMVQEIFIKAYTNIQSFDLSRKFSAWIYRIAHNEFINAIKKKGKEPLPIFNLDILWPYHISKEKADREVNLKELQKMLNKCLDKISPKYRETLILYYFEELSYQEIADIMHIPIATVGIRLKRGKENMKFLLKKYGFNK